MNIVQVNFRNHSKSIVVHMQQIEGERVEEKWLYAEKKMLFTDTTWPNYRRRCAITFICSLFPSNPLPRWRFVAASMNAMITMHAPRNSHELLSKSAFVRNDFQIYVSNGPDGSFRCECIVYRFKHVTIPTKFSKIIFFCFVISCISFFLLSFTRTNTRMLKMRAQKTSFFLFGTLNCVRTLSI